MPKSNKTSHVLSLLVNDLDAAAEDAGAVSQPPHPEPPPTSRKRRAPAKTSKAEKAEVPEKPSKTEKQTAEAPEKAAKAENHTAETPEKPPKAEKHTAKTSEKPPKAARHTVEKPSRSTEEAVALEIRNALEEALEKEVEHSGGEPAAQTPVSVSAEPDAKTKPKPRSFVLPSFDLTPEESEAPPFAPVPAPQPAAAPEPPGPTRPPVIYPSIPEDDEPFCFNVTQALVEAKASKYIDLFGLCPCPRCRADVIALALSRLPSKYVVATQSELVSLLSDYEDKYKAAVASQLMRACTRVAENPRHTRA